MAEKMYTEEEMNDLVSKTRLEENVAGGQKINESQEKICLVLKAWIKSMQSILILLSIFGGTGMITVLNLMGRDCDVEFISCVCFGAICFISSVYMIFLQVMMKKIMKQANALGICQNLERLILKVKEFSNK